MVICFFFFKQKTAYEMRSSDWSSDVGSSDLAVASAGFEVDTANDDRNVIIAKPRSPSKSYADLSAEAAVLMAKAGEAVQWAGPVVRTKSINDAEPKDRGDILIPTDVVIVKIHEDVAQARALELAEEKGLTLLKGNTVDNREFYFQLSKDRSDVNVFPASQAYAKSGISDRKSTRMNSSH